METKGQQLILDIWIDPCESLSKSIKNINKVINKNFNIVKKTKFKFSPHGETIVYILSESHYSLHSYPENHYLSIDIYVCNMSYDLNNIKNLILDQQKVLNHKTQIIKRGTFNYCF